MDTSFLPTNMKRLRAERHLTQKQLAMLSGYTRGCIGMLETGARGAKIPHETAHVIAKVLGVEVSDLFAGPRKAKRRKVA